MPNAAIPFDAARLDRLMDEAGMDVLIATSKHNVQYLLGGHRAFFFDYMDAMGLSRYLPVMVYAKGAPDKAAYFGHRLENFQRENHPFWTSVQQCNSSGSVDTMQKAIEYIKKSGIKTAGVGAELSFLPVDAGKALQDAFAGTPVKDALFVLERMRSIKTKDELAKLKIASEAVIESMKAVIAGHKPGASKDELTEALRREETNRGLTFEYCLITAGTSLNRAPSEQVWGEGDILSLDSGGNYHGYIGDVCRMAIHGEPDAELQDMLADIEEVQRASMKPIKAGAMGSEVYRVAEERLAKSKYHNNMHFLAHGMGLVSHEAPRLTNTGPVPYDDYDAHRPLEAGMVISVETTLAHPKRGFIKLEDTAIVTPSGCDIYGEGARGWNRGGTAAR
ncbi:M24 family metallopeptidase [Rhodoplanes sp. Z2-YC6860]|uniref:M24 family metallopeptidase n=1 Tax=Rhodoplanes sp. Z2-YC6860 TaxID=674703 RepID=UPI00078DA0CD|nr:Xaa-Pro peptidase family protein [Rhodoplanes sp. Z2-YC6860]AMN41814.1 proline dipeptidase [Rhodoplanes sp. Z2-YC6860]